jgi:phosphate/sulfate permease
MQFKRISIIFSWILLPVFSFMISACSLPVAPDTNLDTSGTEENATIVYKEFSIPDPERISFELPEGWDFWANAGYLSPDDGQTLAGVRFSWITEGRDAEALLYNEGSIIHEKTTIMVGELETHRYTIEVTLTSAATGEIIWHAYELIYAFPTPQGDMMAGVAFSAKTIEELEPLIPIAEHMVSSIKWN